uniref:Conserved protein n=1 Tax=Caenorhabditis tropicalis TaxID=1561998 RepID=A0A1I7TY73_9PELO
MSDVNESIEFWTEILLLVIISVMVAIGLLIIRYNDKNSKLDDDYLERPNSLFGTGNLDRKTSWFTFTHRSSPRGSIPKIIISPEVVLPGYRDLESGGSPLPSLHDMIASENDKNHLRLPSRI